MFNIYQYAHIAAYYRHKAAHDLCHFADWYGLADAYRMASQGWTLADR
jgi:hypothetical protein